MHRPHPVTSSLPHQKRQQGAAQPTNKPQNKPNPTPPPKTTTTKMSAPQQGRQSPEPERQTGAQQQAPPAKPNDQGAGPGEKAADASQNQLNNLASNPKGPLDDAAHEKTK
ncbi:hypothetical protein MBLNU230_g4181t1 [Neophaeotheca triangularis]